MSDMKVMDRVKNARHQHVSKDVLRLMEEPHTRKMKYSKFCFLKFDMVPPNLEKNELERIAGFVNPEVFPLLRGKHEMRADGKKFAHLFCSNRL